MDPEHGVARAAPPPQPCGGDPPPPLAVLVVARTAFMVAGSMPMVSGSTAGGEIGGDKHL